MSTDTDYVITIKGKDAALRKAAADYIELLLKPWTPQRNNKKTLIRIDVFRNESNARGLLAPSSLCEDAAKLFPGTDVSFKSKNEYGNTEDGQWNEEGEPPKDPNSTVALKVLERIQSDVESLENRADWLIPLAEWASSTKTAKKTVELIDHALANAENAKKEVTAKLEDEAERQNRMIIEGVEALESVIRWSFHPVLAAQSRPVGRVGKSMLCQAGYGILDEEKNILGEVWRPLKTSTSDAALGEDCHAVALGSPIIPDSKTAAKFIESQAYDPTNSLEGPRVFVRTGKCILGVGAHIRNDDEAFLWIHSREYPSDSLKSNLRKSTQLAEKLEGGTVGEIIDEVELSGDKHRRSSGNYQPQRFGQEITCSLAVSSSQIFLATRDATNQNRPFGRIFSLALADGALAWTSELRFHDCKELIISDPSSLLAVITIEKAYVLVCLETSTGRELWRAVLETPKRPDFQLAASGEVAVLLSYDSEKASLSWWRINSGENFILKQLPEEDWNQPGLAIDSTQVYVGNSNILKAFNLEGKETWTSLLSKGDSWDPCKIVLTGKGTTLICRGQRGVNCLACETGATIWQVQDANIWDGLVGTNDRAYFSTGEAYEARSCLDGSLLWQANQLEGSDYSRRPAVVTDKVFIGVAINRETLSGFLEWFDKATGAALGSVCISTKSTVIMTQDSSLVCVGSFWIGPDQLICADLNVGSPQGPWPMSRQGEGCAAFLPTVEKSGNK